MKPTVYIETSVLSYYVSRPSRDLIVAGHQQITHEWWTRVLPDCQPHISVLVLAESERGDPEMASRRLEVVQGMALLGITDEIDDLADLYARQIGIPERSNADAYHLAIASWHGLDYLVTWNCRHIAAARVRQIVHTLNDERGIQTPEICTPEELMEIDHV